MFLALSMMLKKFLLTLVLVTSLRSVCLFSIFLFFTAPLLQQRHGLISIWILIANMTPTIFVFVAFVVGFNLDFDVFIWKDFTSDCELGGEGMSICSIDCRFNLNFEVFFW